MVLLRRDTLRRVALGLGFGVIAGATVASLWRRQQARLRVVVWRIQPREWAGRAPVRLVVISDLHLGGFGPGADGWHSDGHGGEQGGGHSGGRALRRLAAIVARANALRPDLAVILGQPNLAQCLSPDSPDLAAIAAVLAGFQGDQGCFAVLGRPVMPAGVNPEAGFQATDAQPHDAPSHDPAGQIFAMAGITVLDGLAIRIGKGDGGFWLTGLGEPEAVDDGPIGQVPPTTPATTTAPAPQPVLSDEPDLDPPEQTERMALDGALRRVTDDAPVVLLTHEPEVFPLLGSQERAIPVVVSGPSHGRQIPIGAGRPLVLSRDRETYSWGRYDETGRTLIVSGGIARPGHPLDARSQPEITVIDISASDEW